MADIGRGSRWNWHYSFQYSICDMEILENKN